MTTNGFAADIYNGLSSSPKSLPSKYFYDEKGDELFVKIMHSPEYYLTNCEMEIFQTKAKDIIQKLGVGNKPFRLYELGAGNGEKTLELLKELQDYSFAYYPIDISNHALEVLQNRINKELAKVKVNPLQGEYFEVLGALNGSSLKVILFLGSNLGNMTDEKAHQFLKKLGASMNQGDKLLIGLDLKKSRDIVLPAYNDKQGYTKEFNLNLLRRINKELAADFNPQKFKHVPQYDEAEGIASSYLESQENQVVHVEKLKTDFQFKKGERIKTEVSRKYDREIIDKIIEGTGLKIKHFFYDQRKYFADVLFEKR